MGPDELVTMTYVARRYYLENISRVEIASEIRASRFKVARMLEKARELGIVRIEIGGSELIDAELSLSLKQRFGLTRALAVRVASVEPESIQDALGQAASQLLEEIVTDNDFLGFTAGRTLDATARHLTRIARCDLVALGGVAGPVREHGIEIIRRVARISGGHSYPIFAPLFIQNRDAAASLRADPLIKDAFRRFSRVTKGVVAIGSWSPPESQLYDATAEAGLAEQLVAKGAVGEVCATIFDRDGRTITDTDPLSIAITADELRRIPEVIAVAGGPRKSDAVRAALRSGLISSLVTDTALATRLLADDPADPAPSKGP